MNKDVIFVAVVGFIGAGKDTVTRYIAQKDDFARDSFASTLKDVCSSLFNWPRHLLEGDTKESREWREQVDQWWANKLGDDSFTPRKALQNIGTEVFRNHFHTDIWLLTFLNRLENRNKGKNIIVSDCRFKNEIEFFKKVGGKIIFVDNGHRPEWYSIALEANSGNISAMEKLRSCYPHVHQSESDWIGIDPDIVIDNSFEDKSEESLKELLKRVDDVILKLRHI